MPIDEKYPLALPAGTILAGQYTIDKVLGQGGFGITYKATDYKTGGKVAVKEFFPDTLAYREKTTVIPESVPKTIPTERKACSRKQRLLRNLSAARALSVYTAILRKTALRILLWITSKE